MQIRLPWYVKIAAKLVLSHLPVGYGLWRKFNLFSHGAMHKPDYAYRVFRQHYERSQFGHKDNGFVALELGPGDSVLSAVVAAAHGASKCYLIDMGYFATTELKIYQDMAHHLSLLGLPVPDLKKATDITEILRACNAVYGIGGGKELRKIASESVDFVWSHAVLEHIRRNDFLDFIKELRRILRPDGVCSHRVDLKDHLGGALNNMRMSSKWWEADFMVQSGFYTNRLRYSQMIEAFRQAGFKVEMSSVNRWHNLPTARKVMAQEFKYLSDEDLQVKEFDVLLRCC